MRGKDIYAETLINCPYLSTVVPEYVLTDRSRCYPRTDNSSQFREATSFDPPQNESKPATATGPAYLMFQGASCPCAKTLQRSKYSWLLENCDIDSLAALWVTIELEGQSRRRKGGKKEGRKKQWREKFGRRVGRGRGYKPDELAVYFSLQFFFFFRMELKHVQIIDDQSYYETNFFNKWNAVNIFEIRFCFTLNMKKLLKKKNHAVPPGK